MAKKLADRNAVNNIKDILNNGGVGIIATDTIYGMVGQALNESALERIYKLKLRQPSKPFIILINSLADLVLFDIQLSDDERDEVMKFWPGPVSIILRCENTKLSYLHHGGSTLAFRMPAKNWLRNIIKSTGPLVAPSANPEGQPPADTIKQAKTYFGNNVDFYQSGKTTNRASKIIQIIDGEIIVVRD
ncbi:MAG TPA: L-threonylcarbamoyladenylate synthase [Candidatus Angelobacter sp.]|nr:L-threonylcarbamoyladenylate synthase [Candidatus Angelobacter sp.]